MELLLSFPAGIFALVVVFGSQVVSFVFLIVVAYEYRHLILSRGQLFAVMKTGDVLHSTRIRFILLFTYVLTIFFLSATISIILLFRPHVF